MAKVYLSQYDKATDGYLSEIYGAMGRHRKTQKDVAKRLGKCQSTMSVYLRDIDRFKFGDVRALASYLGLEIIIREKGSNHD